MIPKKSLQNRFCKGKFSYFQSSKCDCMPQTTLSYSHLSDMELFALAKHENMEAFEVVYKRHWPELIDAAYKRLQSRQKAEDIVQEIFISLYNKRNVLELTVSLKAYLSKALKYKVLNEFRSEAVRSNYMKSSFFKEYCKNDFAEHLEAKELHSKIDLLLMQLPDKCRQVFNLSRNENMTNKEIAVKLNISVSTVEKHICKALKVLKGNLKTYAYA
jgi:RNA polymerase sigma-70 factor (family 1)